MLKKIGAFFLVIILCTCSLTSCLIVVDERSGNKDEGYATVPETTVHTNNTEKIPPLTDVVEVGQSKAQQRLEELFPNSDFEEADINICIVDQVDINISAEQESSYSRASKIQNELIMAKFNCNIYVNTVDMTTFLRDAKAALGAGINYADLVYVPQKCIGYMREEGLLADLNALYGDVFVGDCYNIDAKIQASGGNALYAIAGDAALTPSAYMCVFFNKKITDAYGITDQLYSSFSDGSWTLDKMLEFKAMCSSHPDLIDITVESTDIFIESMFAASGMKYINTTVDATPKVAENGDRLVNMVNRLKEVLSDASRITAGNMAIDVFDQSKALFYIASLDAMTAIMGTFGVMPLPKLDSQQEGYYTHTTGDAFVFAVLNSNTRPAYAGELIRAYHEIGFLTVDAWMRDLLDYVLHDENSYIVIKSLLGSLNYDFAYMYGERYEAIANSSYNAVKNAVYTNWTYEYYVYAASWRYASAIRSLFG